MIRTPFVAAALAFAIPATAVAAPQLAPVWSDHIVVQRDMPIRVEGTASARERVSGTLGNADAVAQADSQGRFTLEFMSYRAGLFARTQPGRCSPSLAPVPSSDHRREAPEFCCRRYWKSHNNENRKLRP